MIEESLAGTTRHPLNKAVPNGGEEMTGAGVAIAEVGATVFCTLVVIVTLAAMSESFDGENVKSALVVGTAITDVRGENESNVVTATVRSSSVKMFLLAVDKLASTETVLFLDGEDSALR